MLASVDAKAAGRDYLSMPGDVKLWAYWANRVPLHSCPTDREPLARQ
jgi:hypothetical protein